MAKLAQVFETVLQPPARAQAPFIVGPGGARIPMPGLAPRRDPWAAYTQPVKAAAPGPHRWGTPPRPWAEPDIKVSMLEGSTRKEHSMHHAFIPTVRGGINGALGTPFVPGHAAAPAAPLAQGLIEQVLKSPWLAVGLKAGTGALLIALALSTTDWAQLAALLGGAYWLFSAAAGVYTEVTPEPEEPAPRESLVM